MIEYNLGLPLILINVNTPDTNKSSENPAGGFGGWARFKSSLFFKVFLLVILPITIQSALLVLITQFWTQVVHDLDVEKEKLLVVRKLNSVTLKWLRVSNFILEHGNEERSLIRKPLEQQVAKLNADFAAFKNSISDKETIDSVSYLERSLADQVNAILSTRPSSFSSAASLQGLPRLFANLYKNCNHLRDLIDKKNADLESAQIKEDSSLWFMKSAVFAFGSAALILAFFLAQYISKHTKMRLGILMRSAGRLPENELIPGVLEGNDEFSYVEKSICDASHLLHDAAEHRSSVLGMVAHDMRSPLQAVLTVVSIMKEYGSAQGGAAYSELLAAERQVQSILQHVDSILTVERKPTATEQSSKLRTRTYDDALPQSMEPQKQGFLLQAKIIHKMMLLVLIPMIVQAGLLVFLVTQIWNTEHMTAIKRRCSRVQINLNKDLVDETRAVSADLIYLLTGHLKLRALAKKIFDEIDKRFVKLQEVCADDTGWAEQLKLASTSQREFKNKVLSLYRGQSVDFIIGTLTNKEKNGYTISQKALDLMQRDDNLISKLDADQLAISSLFGKLLVWSIAGNYALASGLLGLFYFDIAGRLKTLVKNAESLGKRTALEKSISGGDEFAMLDQMLHRASVQLQSASQQRRQLMSTLADEMRKPLQQTRVHLSNFENQTSLQDEEKNMLVKAQNGIRRILALTNDLLSMEDLDTGKLELQVTAGDAVEIASEAIATVSSLAKRKKIKVVNECSSVRFACDPDRLTQVLVNFLGNAIKFSPEKTQITVGCRPSTDSITLLVKDQGPGMDRATSSKVFDKYFQAPTEEKKLGFGLGLAICKLIAETHGGTVGVDSEPGSGSVFWIEIPSNVGSRI